MTTEGLTVVLSDEVVGTEPIAIGDVKAYLNINFDAHDTKITRLISACRSALEQYKSVTLIQSRSVTLSWQTFHHYEDLLYLPVDTDNDNEIIVTTLSGESVETSGYNLVNIAGRVVFSGEFPDGVKVSYKTKQIEISDLIKEGLIRAVAHSFENATPPREAIKMEFKYVQI